MLTHDKLVTETLKAKAITENLADEVFRIAELDPDSEFFLISYLEESTVKLSVTKANFTQVTLADLTPAALHKYSMYNVNLSEWTVGNVKDFPLVKNISLIEKFKRTLGIPKEDEEYKHFKI